MRVVRRKASCTLWALRAYGVRGPWQKHCWSFDRASISPPYRSFGRFLTLQTLQWKVELFIWGSWSSILTNWVYWKMRANLQVFQYLCGKAKNWLFTERTYPYPHPSKRSIWSTCFPGDNSPVRTIIMVHLQPSNMSLYTSSDEGTHSNLALNGERYGSKFVNHICVPFVLLPIRCYFMWKAILLTDLD